MVTGDEHDAALHAMRAWTLPVVTLTSWPTRGFVVDPGICVSDPERSALLRDRLPDVSGDAWSIAQQLMAWVTTRWDHDGWNEGGDADALDLLERAEAGESFRCVEFAVLLAGALNAVGIPSRTVGLRRAGYARPVPGMGHVAMEAWIDSLASWVHLDAQNGAWWETGGAPMSALDLARMHAAGAPPPRFRGADGDRADANAWWSYFDSVTVGTTMLAHDGSPTLTFQQFGWLSAARILIPEHHEAAYPLLHHVDVAVGSSDVGTCSEPVATLVPVHPFATGVAIDGVVHEGREVAFALSTRVGDHSAALEVVTPLGAFPAGTLAWRVAEPAAPPSSMEELRDIL